MRSKIFLGLILSILIFILGYSIVRVPTLDMPDDYYTNLPSYSDWEFDIINEYHVSFDFVRISKCNVICPNERGFPFTMKYEFEYDTFRLDGFFANTIIAIVTGMTLSIFILKGIKYIRIKMK
jgi:hypothetical protein